MDLTHSKPGQSTEAVDEVSAPARQVKGLLESRASASRRRRDLARASLSLRPPKSGHCQWSTSPCVQRCPACRRQRPTLLCSSAPTVSPAQPGQPRRWRVAQALKHSWRSARGKEERGVRRRYVNPPQPRLRHCPTASDVVFEQRIIPARRWQGPQVQRLVNTLLAAAS